MKLMHRTLRAAAAAVLLLTASGCGLQPDTPGPNPTGYALIYGISDYNPPGPSYKDLSVCDDDALAINELFSAHEYTTTLRLDGNVTKEALYADFKAATTALKPGDTFVMYFSGHGGQFDISGSVEADAAGDGSATGNGIGYDGLEEVVAMSGYFETKIIGGRAVTERVEDLLTDDELAKLFSSIPATKKMLILDTCRSGGFVGPGPALDTNPQDYKGSRGWNNRTLGLLFDSYNAYSGSEGADILPSQTVVLTAAGEREDSWEDTNLPYKHGIFTYYFLEAAKQGDLNLDGYISIMELFGYATEKIESEWNLKYPSRSYLPRISGSPFDFMLFRPAP